MLDLLEPIPQQPHGLNHVRILDKMIESLILFPVQKTN